jgi:Flp pilus assembly protein TadG
LKIPVQKRRAQSGQAVLLVILAMGTFLLGAVGLAVDGAHLYAQRQMAQAAADAAAQAGIMSIFDDSNVSGSTHYFDPATGVHTCGTGDAGTPCYYAQTLNGFSGTADTVTYEPNSPVSVTGLSSDPVNRLRVTVQRNVPTTLIRMLGPTAATIKATGTAAILTVMAPVPILVLHPTLSSAFDKNGSNDITICGGPALSIQVNSKSLSGGNISGASGSIDLSHAGPLDPGDCSTGTGANFGDVGGPNPLPHASQLQFGTQPGKYVQPASSIEDPLLGLVPPTQPTLPGGIHEHAAAGTGGCPASYSAGCDVYWPGYYASGGINPSGVVLFRPGIYYINHGGFHLGSNTIVRMATGTYASDPQTGTGWTQGMLLYNSPATPVDTHNDFFEIKANAGKIGSNTYPDASQCGTDSAGNALGGNCMVGAGGGALTTALCSSSASLSSAYYGILFFQNHATATSLTHSLQGGGGLSLKGTIYLTHTKLNIASDGTYQSLTLQGTSGSSTKVQGEIIVDKLSLGGTSGITMNLSGLACYHVRQVALVL